jgi:hypothetical protein
MSQFEDLAYGYEREKINHPRIEKHLDCKLNKLGKFDIMDWEEVPVEGDESPRWLVEQKARNMSFEFCSKRYETVIIGKNKIDYMKNNGGNGVVYFDFTDKLMYWVFDEDEYPTFHIQENFVRRGRIDCVDKPSPVIHIPCSLLLPCPF